MTDKTTTARHYKKFKDYVLYWKERFGLSHWRIYFKHEYLADSYATCVSDASTCLATITLSTSWDRSRELNDEELSDVAKHEMIHVLLARMRLCTKERFISAWFIEDAEEELVRYLLRLIS